MTTTKVAPTGATFGPAKPGPQQESSLANEDSLTANKRHQHEDVVDVLDRTRAFLTRFVAFPSESGADAATLWVAHTHAFEAAYCTPRLAALSAEKQSGKTRLLEVLKLLTNNAKQVSSLTDAAMFRLIEQGPISILYDEIDAVFGPKVKDDKEGLRALLNAGYQRGATATRCEGPKNEPKDYATFAPVALAGIGNLPDTIEDRSIILRMRRRAPHERVDKLRLRYVANEAGELQDDLHQVFSGLVPALEDHIPEPPPGLSDRAEDVWEPLFAIADMASPQWAARARDAAIRLADRGPEDESVTVRLLGDVRDAFGDDVRLWSSDLCERLAKITEAPWGDWYGKPLEPRGLARLLKGHRIKTTQLDIGGTNKRGYKRESFEDAWARYLPDLGSHEPDPGDLDARSDSPLVPIPSNGNSPSGLADLAAREPTPEDLGAWTSDTSCHMCGIPTDSAWFCDQCATAKRDFAADALG